MDLNWARGNCNCLLFLVTHSMQIMPEDVTEKDNHLKNAARTDAIN